MAYAQARVKAAQPRHAEELAAVEAEIRRADEALDRYFQAFESGTMPDATCAPRVEALAEKLRGLKVRKGELQAAVDDEEQVQAPAPAELAQLRALIGNVMKLGPAAQRKALLQELVVEVRVQSREAILPVFRLPSTGVRPLSQVVRPGGLEPPLAV